ncbi:hypothetical protein BMF94_1670 [Rhodotorula taiwanensis]|uniref:Tetratricopeptide SHNi-TPR domain-containing protein n=1 Tax=Rhodotorula taiwanensis TaxID=741276 RepID=A0A2S5BEV7_9BASI|nr:hypothetical protein BMF94_1670 [Rhodotorula taiwanensis]
MSTAAAPPTDDHLARGIRSLALKHWSNACDHLAQAVEQATAKYGDLAPENVEPLILYGKALLGSAIAQSAVLGGAAPTGPTGEEAASSTAGPSTSAASTSNGNGQSANAAAAGPSKPNFHFGGDGEDDDEDDDGEEDGQEGEQEGADGEGEAASGDREDDLESAFQVLDMARATLEKELNGAASLSESKTEQENAEKATLEKKEKLAEVHRLLGDVATESEQFEPAVEEYTAALEVLSTVYSPSNRALSELHMLIALALDFVPNGNDRAVLHAEKAKKVLLLKLDELEAVKEGDRDDKTKREIEDIKGLMGDVDMKIEDLRTVPVAPAPSAADSALEAFLRQSSATLRADPAAPVNDLSSLVKKKKKVEPAPGIIQEEVKEPAVEENVIVIKKQEGDEVPDGKRKADDDATTVGEGVAKKAKVEGDDGEAGPAP